MAKLDRALRLVQLLADAGEGLTLDEIATALGISRRTAERLRDVIVVPAFSDAFAGAGEWRRMAWWIHDHLPYHSLEFFPRLWAFNISWREVAERCIYAYAAPKGCLTRPGMPNHAGDHEAEWAGIETAMEIRA